MQAQFRPAQPLCFIDQRPQQGIADAVAAPVLQHRHPPDLALGRQPAGADGPAGLIAGDHMHAERVEFVPFQR